MGLVVTGLGHADVAEVVECLLTCADTGRDTVLCAYRRNLAHLLGDALDSLPAPRVDADEAAVL